LDIEKKYTQRYDTAVHYCKNIRLRVKTGGKTYSSMCQSNLQLQNETALMSCRIRLVEHRHLGWTVWCTPRFARSNFAELHKNWESA